MLKKFAVENYRNFKDRIEIDFGAVRNYSFNLSLTDRAFLCLSDSCQYATETPGDSVLLGPGRGWLVHPWGQDKSGTEQGVPGRVHVPVH